jgi:hypothetical protein
MSTTQELRWWIINRTASAHTYDALSYEPFGIQFLAAGTSPGAATLAAIGAGTLYGVEREVPVTA